MNLLRKIQNSFWVPAIILVFLILELGLPHNKIIELLFESMVILYLGLFMGRTIKGFQRKRKTIVGRSIFIAIAFVSVLMIISTLARLIADYIFVAHGLYYLLLFIFAIIDISTRFIIQGKDTIHPTLAFVISFIVVIWVGTFLLMLPNATTKGISLIDALFTSTSATCVTGLAVVDTGKDFTFFGQMVILMLIQVGGLGILTFTNLFGLIFRGNSSFKNRIFMSELVGDEDLGNTYATVINIILFTFVIEAIGAICIYLCMENGDFFFSVFHAVSAFCNAGFSTMSNSLYEADVRFNYPLHIVIALLIIVGGLGYTPFYSYYLRIKYRVLCFLRETFSLHHWQLQHPPASRDLNTYLITRTTFVLLLVGWVMFFVLEYNYTLADHDSFGAKLAVSFFGSVTPRTAGFNSVDMTAMALPTVLLYFLLMWIGGSPGSTAGGIKTTTFAIATLNIWNQIRGRAKLVLYYREIAGSTINRVSSIISLSLIAVGTGTFLISISDPDLALRDTAFECFSAYATVGLSLGITAKFSIFGKIIIIILMFLGRVSFLSFIIALFSLFFRQKEIKQLDYPKADIFVN